ncbi:MAG TPA: MG2 domain-containing protein, partial [Phycisphaerales bacterium]|nr:MG2 domain-containing protein [Phycisphaerales bacterium]
MSVQRTAAAAMLFVVLCAAGLLRGESPAPTRSDSQYESLKDQAEKQYADGNYSRAKSTYENATKLELSVTDSRWVTFRIADCQWRADAETQNSDTTQIEEAQRQLENVIREYTKVEDRDIVWVSAEESLGDFWWSRSRSQNWGSAWPYYQAALDYWAGSADLDAARERYLNIVWKAAEPAWMLANNYQYWWHQLPIEVCDNAVKIAKSDEEKSHAHYLTAIYLRQQGGSMQSQQRIGKELESVIALGKKARWMDDALFMYAQYMESTGNATFDDKNGWQWKPDYVKALELYRRIMNDYQKGETPYFDQAKARIENITGPAVSVHVSNFFLPDSEIQYYLTWRNVPRVDLTLYAVDLSRDVKYPAATQSLEQWIDYVDLSTAEKVRTWTKDTGDDGTHVPGNSQEELKEKLPMGAYVLVAQAGDKSERACVLVSNASLIVKAVNDKTLVFYTDAVSGAPIAGAQVQVTQTRWNNQQQLSQAATKTTDAQGLCLFEPGDFPSLPKNMYGQYYVGAKMEGRQAFAVSSMQMYSAGHEPWKIYAFTDRPAYRPEDTVHWKLFARQWTSAGFVTPKDAVIEYQINDPQGAKLKEGTAELNAYGSAWGEFELSKSSPLGAYQVTFWNAGKKQHIGSATLFRTEEYKLPEYQVTVKPPMDEGKPKAYLLGETVQLDIHGEYYFGGPVANATVEVVVKQRPYYQWWRPTREYPWVYDEQNPYRYWYGGGQVVKQETLHTDAQGNASLSLETDANASQDQEYDVEARMVDASRREITANGIVRVGKQTYSVHPQPEHTLYKPGDKATVQYTTIDINDQPVSVEGTVRVTREVYSEVWVDPNGRDVTGSELWNLKSAGIFPPAPPRPDMPAWRMKSAGYTSEEILTQTVKTDDKGEGELVFTPQQEGYYKVSWVSRDRNMMPITADTWVWVVTNDTTALAYRTNGLDIIVDKDTFRSGVNAPVMISTPTNDRYVLFSVEGNDLYSYQVVHVTGNVKLINVPIDQRHIPNVYLNAAMMQDGQMYADQESVTIPPVEQYLKVDVSANKSQYQPQEEGTLTVTTKDADDKPVSAEVALALVDESVYFIQQDFAGDPRPFFFEQRQGQYVRTDSTASQRAFIRLVKNAKGEVVDVRMVGTASQLSHDEPREAGAKELYAYNGMGMGGGGGMDGYGDYARSVSAEAAPMARREMGKTAAPPVPPGSVAGRANGQLDSMEAKLGMPVAGGEVGGDKPGENPVQVRSDFRATLLWEPAIVTSENGTAQVKTKYADSLTAWKAVARVVGAGNQFGMGEARTQTKLPLIARLQAPRFFTVGDEVTISGVINNNTDQAMKVTPKLEAEGVD